MSANEIFEYYRSATSFSQDDVADFYVYTQDSVHPTDGLMAIAGLTINLLENPWNQDHLMLLITCCDGISPEGFERVVVGLLLAMMQHDTYIRRDRNLLGEIQEVLTYAPELSFTALSNIARTTQMKRMEQFNAQLTKELLPLMNDRASNEFYDIIRSRQSEMEHIAKMHLDQNFLLFREFYSTPFFRAQAANWLLPWTDEALLGIDEEDRNEVESLMQLWPLCDSDKYALCHMYKSFKQMIKSQLSVDSLREVGMDMQGKTIVTNGYIQQLYRFFRLSSFAKTKPFDLANKLRELLVYRLVVVGSQAQQSISQLLA
ncbi:MAG: hypothetical protein IJ000_01865 [Paludibacteraceae bacterium]|nr:hypothetical protein [Paludibacteraceae bacterium]